MTSAEDEKMDKLDFYDSLQVLSNSVRMKIYKYISEVGGKIPFGQILKRIYPNEDKNKSPTLSNHLKKIIDAHILNKDNNGYYVTPLGRELYQHVMNMERVFSNFNKELMVRTSDFSLEPFDEKQIVEFLTREANYPKLNAQKIANITKKRLSQANIEYLTTPLIREYLNSVLLDNGLEEVRHKLTRLGLPPYDIKRMLKSSNLDDLSEFFKELGKNMFSQYLLLNMLPQGNADFYLSGRLFFLNPQSWGLIPSELIIHGDRFAELIINRINKTMNFTKDIPKSHILNEKIQKMSIIIEDFVNDLKEFFSRGVVITDIEACIKRFCDFFELEPKEMSNYLFSSLPSSNHYTSLDSRGLNDENWEMWFEINTNNLDLDNESDLDIFKAIINIYYQDCAELFQFNNSDKSIRYNQLLERFSLRPNLILNISGSLKEKILLKTSGEKGLDYINEILTSGIYHSIMFCNEITLVRSKKPFKKTITPNFTPIQINKEEFAGQQITPKPQVVLDKIFINLPRIIQIAENINDLPIVNDTPNSRKSTANKNVSPKTIDNFFIILKDWVFNAMNLFDKKFSLISKNTLNFKRWNYISDSLFGKEFLDESGDILDYSGSIKIICNISLNGLIESIKFYTGFHPEQNKASLNLFNEIITFVKDILKNNSNNPSIEYVLSLPHLDNYIQTKFIQDINLLQNLTSDFVDIAYIKNSKRKKPVDSKNYSITNYMDKRVEIDSKNIFPYDWSVDRYDNKMELEKFIGNHLKKRESMGDSIFLDIFLKNGIVLKPNKSINDIYHMILEKDVQFFAFSRILGENSNQYYRYGGNYKSIKHFDNLIKNRIYSRKDNLL